MDDPEDEEELESVLPCWKLGSISRTSCGKLYSGLGLRPGGDGVRWGYVAVGYINEEDSWAWLDQIAEKMTDVFDSWTESVCRMSSVRCLWDRGV